MPKFEQYDLVRVVMPHEEDQGFKGAIGIITEVDEKAEYPYEIIFAGKKHNEKSREIGTFLWKDYQLEAI